MLPNFSYIQAKSIPEAIRCLAADGARLHAGGTDLLGCLREGILAAATVVSISRLEELKGIRTTADGGLRIGTLTTLAEIAAHPLVREKYRTLAQAAAAAASPQLRSQGTIGGNLCQKPRCWYYRGEFDCLRKGGERCFAVEGENRYHCIFGGAGCYMVHPSDTAPALAALDAVLQITGPQGNRRVALEDFHVPPSRDVTRETVLEPAEIVTDVILPPPAPGLQSSYRKVRARRAWDFALAGVALALVSREDRVHSGRVFLSGAAPIPWRSKEIEAAITGKRLDRDLAQKAAQAGVQDAEPLPQNDYKIPLFRGVVEEALLSLANR